MRRLLRGRADAPPLIRRLLLSMAGVLALGLPQLESMAGWEACSGSRCRSPPMECWRLVGSSRGRLAAVENS